MSASFFRDARWRRFLLVGGVCFSTNLMVLYVGTELVGLHYLVSKFFSIFVTNTLGWSIVPGKSLETELTRQYEAVRDILTS